MLLSKRKGFTLLEIVYVIVIIGVISVMAIPKLKHLVDNSKISSELSTASSVQTAIDSCHGEWIINEGDFVCGASISSSDLNAKGYPSDLGDHLEKILKNGSSTGWRKNGSNYIGPASDPNKGTNHCKDGKPCIGKCWNYDDQNGTFSLSDNC